MHILAIRHAARDPIRNWDQILSMPINQKGVIQTNKLGLMLSESKLFIKPTIYTSNVERCLETGSILRDYLPGSKLQREPIDSPISLGLIKDINNLNKWWEYTSTNRFKSIPEFFIKTYREGLLRYRYPEEYFEDFMSKIYNNHDKEAIIITHDIVLAPIMYVIFRRILRQDTEIPLKMGYLQGVEFIMDMHAFYLAKVFLPEIS